MLRGISLIVLLFICLPLDAKEVFPFEGKLNIDAKEFSFLLRLSEESRINVALKPTDTDARHLTLDLEHIRTPFFDLTTQIHSNIEWTGGPQNQKEMTGRLWSQYSLVNGQPIPEFSAEFSAKDKLFKVNNLLIGNYLTQLSVGLVPPHAVNANVDIKAVDLAKFMDWLSQGAYKGMGIVDGEMTVSGPLKQLALKGYLESYNGFIENLQFERIHINLNGTYPIVDLSGSSMTQTNRFSFNLEGKFDLSDRKNFTQQIKQLKKIALIDKDSSETQWNMKRVPVEEEGKSGEMQYFIRKDQGMDWIKDDQTEMLGVEQKIGF